MFLGPVNAKGGGVLWGQNGKRGQMGAAPNNAIPVPSGCVEKNLMPSGNKTRGLIHMER